jgi:hypothetical protein
MKFEVALLALRNGEKIRRKDWGNLKDEYLSLENDSAELMLFQLLANDWEVVPKSQVNIADYLVHDGWSGHTFKDTWHMETFEIGKQPAGAIMIPNSERKGAV